MRLTGSKLLYQAKIGGVFVLKVDLIPLLWESWLWLSSCPVKTKPNMSVQHVQYIWSAVCFLCESESQGPPANQHARSGSGLGEKDLLNFSSTFTVTSKIQRRKDQLLCVLGAWLDLVEEASHVGKLLV